MRCVDKRPVICASLTHPCLLAMDQACKYTAADPDEGMIRSYNEVVANSDKAQEVADLVLDARPHGRCAFSPSLCT